MNRRRFLHIPVALAVLGAGLASAQPARVRRIGFLTLLPFTDPPSVERRAFLEGLAAVGFVPGRNVEILYASAEGSVEFLEDITRDLVAKRPDVIVGSGGIVLQALQRATPTIPVVMLAVGDPVGMKLVKSLARPGGNITGSSFISSDLAAKRMQMLKEVSPRGRTVALLHDARNGNATLEKAAATVAARKLGLNALQLPFSDDAGLSAALRKAATGRAEMLYVTFEGNIVARSRHEIAAFALERKWPSIAGWSGVAEAGGLLSYAPDIPEMFRRGAHFVERILMGDKPADLPVEQATRLELVVNLSTARRIGLAIPQAILLRADRIIE